MLLNELDYKSELTKLALNDGIRTVEEYNIWLTGYMTGYQNGIEALAKRMHEGFNDEQLQSM